MWDTEFHQCLATHHVQKCMNIIHIQMPNLTMLNLKCPSFFHDCSKLPISTPRTLIKIISYKSSLRSPIAIISPFGPLTIHSFWLNCTFNPFNKSMLTTRIIAYNLCTWWAFLIWIVLILPLTSPPIAMESISITFMTLSSPKWIVYGAIILYVSNVIL